MSKIRFYSAAAGAENIFIKEPEFVHKIKNVLRLKIGSSIYLFDGKGKEYLYEIGELNQSHAAVKKIKLERQADFPLRRIILGFPVLREDKVDFILQKAVELGAHAFIPFICERSLQTKPSVQKFMRWQKISAQAISQSGRLWLAEVREVMLFEEIIKEKFDVRIAGSIDARYPSSGLPRGEILFITGPEGDFSPEEWAQLRENNFQFIKLSENLLRAETAAVFGVGVLNAMRLTPINRGS